MDARLDTWLTGHRAEVVGLEIEVISGRRLGPMVSEGPIGPPERDGVPSPERRGQRDDLDVSPAIEDTTSERARK